MEATRGEMEDAAREERRRQAELRAAAAERRMQQFASASPQPPAAAGRAEPSPTLSDGPAWKPLEGKALSDLCELLFGKEGINTLVLQQWTSQGLR